MTDTIILHRFEDYRWRNFLDYAYIINDGKIAARVNTAEESGNLIDAMNAAYKKLINLAIAPQKSKKNIMQAREWRKQLRSLAFCANIL